MPWYYASILNLMISFAQAKLNDSKVTVTTKIAAGKFIQAGLDFANSFVK